MLPLFEEQTQQLSEHELSLVDGFIKGFSSRIGKENAITNKEIIAAYKNRGVSLNDSRVRKIINYIRCNNLIMGLMASSKGYYVSKDKEEIKQYTDSLRGRAMAIKAVMDKMNEYYLTL